ncbi:thiamine phosphate synthase [Thalassotalea castellviae]|uniref:Thiamine-phosphate synthase n=1 Tax=Thalassotalea castellviae TaxID=3075612 RepID=A0ABU3A057_9GAMM|nr:thiamine phosphate synthase [Thalassotalea sp. W431]MDT0603564.1 thiamine phosphate synthase [Thalassotalea sp. W431]
MNKIETKPVVWTIAGSDCSGGAGVQADIKTMHNLGVDVGSVITAVTAQNRFGVEAINPLSEKVILSQIMALEQVQPATVIKIGLLANNQLVELVVEQIKRFNKEWPSKPYIIYDPLAIASNGSDLTEDDTLPTIKAKLLPLVHLLTPNGKEMQKITGVFAFSWQCMVAAAQKILSLGVSATIIKGGHLEIAKNKCIDYGTDGQQSYWLSSNKISSHNTHGTGCTFASAIAALIAQNYALKDAFIIAKAYLNQGLKAVGEKKSHFDAIWQGQWPSYINDYPEVLVNESSLAQAIDWHEKKTSEKPRPSATSFDYGFAALDSKQLGLYPVVDSLEWLERLLKLGIKLIQYRNKALVGEALEQSIMQAIALGKRYKAMLFINDYWHLAIKYNAYGVHLGQEDIQAADLKAIKQAGLRLGISSHGHYELIKVKQYQPSYLAIGAIFPTKTKDMTGQIQGVQTLSDLVKLTPDIPTVAIGGITLARAKTVLNTSVNSIAVVTAITEALEPELAVKKFQQMIKDRNNEYI